MEKHHHLGIQDNAPSPYSSGSSGRPSFSSFDRVGSSTDSHSSRHIVAQEVGGGSFQERTPPHSHVGQQMAQSQTAWMSGSGSNYAVKLPPSMQHHRTAPLEGLSSNGNMVVSVEQIISKLDTASEENTRLRDALRANNQLLDQKLRQFEPLVEDNRRLRTEKDELRQEKEEMLKTRSDATNRFFEARVAVMGFKCRTMQLQGELDEMKKAKVGGHPSLDTGRMQQQIESLMTEKRMLEERNRALSSRAQPGGMDQAVILLERQVADLNKNVYTLQNEKSSYETIVFQLQQDVRSIQDKKQLAEDEKIRAQREAGNLRDELDRLQRDNHALQRQMEHLQNNAPLGAQVLTHKANFEAENLGLQAHVQELKEHIAKLDGELASEKRINDQLRGKVNELEEAKATMRSKLQSYSGSQPREEQPPRPTPAPRTNLQPSLNALQADKERLLLENKELSDRLEVVQQARRTVEDNYQRSSQKAQSIKQEQYQLERQLKEKEGQLVEKTRAYSNLEQELERQKRENSRMVLNVRSEEDRLTERLTELQKEKEELRDRVANLEKANAQRMNAATSLERQELEYRGTIARLEEQLKQMQLESPVAAAPDMSMKTKQPLAKRLNDALGKIRELETLNKGLEDQQARVQGSYKSLQEEHSLLKNKVETEHETQRHAAENRSFQLQRSVDELRAEQSRLCEDKIKLQTELEHMRGDLERKGSQERQLTEQLNSYGRQLTEKVESSEQLQKQNDELKAQLESLRQDKERKTGKQAELQRQYTQVKKRLDDKSTEVAKLSTTVHQLAEEKDQLSEQKQKIEGEKVQLDKTVKEYRMESESILNDYTQAMAELRSAKEEKDRLHQVCTRVTQDLSQQKERSKLLEGQRKDAQEKVSHMDEQLRLYHEDFERERHAREAAIKVKNLAEERMKKMERDMKELRDRLNQQAARRLREDQYDDQQTPEFRKSGEHRFSGSQPSNLQEPNRYSGSRHSGHQEPHPHSGHHHSGPQYPPQNVHEAASLQSPGAPPIPPREHKSIHGTPPSVGGFGAVGGMGVGGGVGGGAIGGGLGGGGGGAVGGAMGGAIGGGAMGGAVGGGVGHMLPKASDHGNMPPHTSSWTQNLPPTQYPANPPRVTHPNTMMVTGYANPSVTPPIPSVTPAIPQDAPLRANVAPPTLPPSGFPGPSSNVGHAASLNRFDTPSQTSLAGHPGPGGAQPPRQPIRAGGGGGMPVIDPGAAMANQLNNLNLAEGDKYVAPGEVFNEAPPSMACPLCGKSDFKTQTDLELHCAQCG